MRYGGTALLAAVLTALGGCANYSVQASSGGATQTTASGGVRVRMSGSSALGAAIVIGALAADGNYRYYRYYADGTEVPVYPPPPLDPSRKINVQDCTKPVDLSAGNLMCR